MGRGVGQPRWLCPPFPHGGAAPLAPLLVFSGPNWVASSKTLFTASNILPTLLLWLLLGTLLSAIPLARCEGRDHSQIHLSSFKICFWLSPSQFLEFGDLFSILEFLARIPPLPPTSHGCLGGKGTTLHLASLYPSTMMSSATLWRRARQAAMLLCHSELNSHLALVPTRCICPLVAVQ